MMRGIIFIMALLILGNVNGQNRDSVQAFVLNPIVVAAENNFIENDAALKPFFLMLDSLKNKNKKKLTIVHIGDSHLQGDYLARTIRYRLQHEFGEAGRGMVFPYSLLNMYGPVDYKCVSNVAWQHSRMFPRERNGPVGLVGYAVMNQSPNMKLTIQLQRPNPLYYGALTNFNDYPTNQFNKLSILYSNDSLGLPLNVSGIRDDNSLGRQIELPQYNSNQGGFQLGEVNLESTFTSLQIQADTHRRFTKPVRLYGLSFENTNAHGILYHMAGVGACQLSDFMGTTYFFKHMVSLKPDLVIISLGANESCTPGFDTVGYSSKLKQVIADLRNSLPGVQVLITTPPDILFRRTRPPSMDAICRTLERTAFAANTGFWNLNKNMGGAWSNAYWFQNKLAGPDRIHFAPRGYDFLGLLLTEALYNSYYRYALTPIDTQSVRNSTLAYRKLFTALQVNKIKSSNLPQQTVTPVRNNPQIPVNHRQISHHGAKYHRVVKGESVYSISRKYGVNHKEVLRLNGFTAKTIIRPGQTIRIR